MTHWLSVLTCIVIGVLIIGCAEEANDRQLASSLPKLLPDNQTAEPTYWGTVRLEGRERLCLEIRRTKWQSEEGVSVDEETIAAACGEAVDRWRYVEAHDGTTIKSTYRLSATIEDGTLRYRLTRSSRFSTDPDQGAAYQRGDPEVGTTYVTAKTDASGSKIRYASSRTTAPSSRPASCENLRETYARSRALAETEAEARGLSTSEMLELPSARHAIDAQRQARSQGCSWAN